jgi:hypothetical protein
VEGILLGERRYRPRTEGLFARILHYRNGATDHWEVKSKDGLKSSYGTPASAGHDPGILCFSHCSLTGFRVVFVPNRRSVRKSD